MSHRLLVVVAVASLCATVHAQTVPQIQLGARTGVITEPFSDLRGLAELNDGRVIVSDRIEKAYLLADFATGLRKAVGTNGTGPREYLIPFGPIRWRGDTLLGHDPNNRRALRIAQDGSVINTIPFARPREGAINGWGAARGVDRQGRIYWDNPIIEMQPAIKRAIKANIVRWLPGSDSVEVVMQFADHGEFEHGFRYSPMPQTDAWVLAPDDRIGILSAARYQLTWYRDGKVVESGPPIPHADVPITASEREAFRAMKASERASGSLAAAPGAGGSSPAMGIERAKIAWPDSLFPPKMPPFEPRGVHLASSGDIWVVRTVSAAEKSARIDVLDTHGRLNVFLRLPAGRRLFALGATSIYLISTDADGLQSLERYSYPRMPR